jgi:prepilin-type N-terminal cleavage/methylation domain-containing protein
MSGRKLGMTLIELIVVTAVIAIVSAILFSVLSSAKTRAKQASTWTAIRQFHVAGEIYIADQGGEATIYDIGIVGLSASSNEIKNLLYSPLDPYALGKGNLLKSDSAGPIPFLKEKYSYLMIGDTYMRGAPYRSQCDGTAFGWIAIPAFNRKSSSTGFYADFNERTILGISDGSIRSHKPIQKSEYQSPVSVFGIMDQSCFDKVWDYAPF